MIICKNVVVDEMYADRLFAKFVHILMNGMERMYTKRLLEGDNDGGVFNSAVSRTRAELNMFLDILSKMDAVADGLLGKFDLYISNFTDCDNPLDSLKAAHVLRQIVYYVLYGTVDRKYDATYGSWSSNAEVASILEQLNPVEEEEESEDECDD